MWDTDQTMNSQASYGVSCEYLSLAFISSGNGLSPVRHQAITWTNDDLMSMTSGDYA